MPRLPGGWFAGSFQPSLPGWPSSRLTTDQVRPPSSDRKTPGISAPANRRPCAAVRPETFETLSPSPWFSYERPSLECSHVSPRFSLRQTATPCHELAAAA